MANEVKIILKADERGAVTAIRNVDAEYSKSTKKMEKETASFVERAKKHWVAYSAAAVGAYLAIDKAIVPLIRRASEFQTALTDMAKVTNENLESIRKKILDLDPALGNSTQMLKAYYQTISAGVTDPVRAMETMTVAAKAANAAHIRQDEVIKGLTKTMAGFEGGIRKVSDASDLLFTIEKEGQTSFQELIPVVGGLAKISHDLGISADEMGGALATVTQTAGSTSEAATEYEAVLVGLMKPTTQLKQLFKEQGYESAQAAIKERGFVGTLEMLKTATGGSAQKMGELLGRKEALIGMSALASNSFGTLTDKIESMGNKTGATQRAFDDWRKTFEGTWETFQNTWGKFEIMVGSKILPPLTKLLNTLIDVVDEMEKFNNEQMLSALNSQISAMQKTINEGRGTIQVGPYWTPGFPASDEQLASEKKHLEELIKQRDALLAVGEAADKAAKANEKLGKSGEDAAGGLDKAGDSAAAATDEIQKLNAKIQAMIDQQTLDVKEQVEKQAEIWNKAGADQVAVEKWVTVQILKIHQDRVSGINAIIAENDAWLKKHDEEEVAARQAKVDKINAIISENDDWWKKQVEGAKKAEGAYQDMGDTFVGVFDGMIQTVNQFLGLFGVQLPGAVSQFIRSMQSLSSFSGGGTGGLLGYGGGSLGLGGFSTGSQALTYAPGTLIPSSPGFLTGYGTPLGFMGAPFSGYGIGSMLFPGNAGAGWGGAAGALGGYALGTTGGIVSGVGSALGLGAAAGSVVPVIGTIVGGILGAALGSLFGGRHYPPEFNMVQVGPESGPNFGTFGGIYNAGTGYAGRWKEGVSDEAGKQMMDTFIQADQSVQKLFTDIGVSTASFSSKWRSADIKFSGNESPEEIQQKVAAAVEEFVGKGLTDTLKKKFEDLEGPGENLISTIERVISAIEEMPEFSNQLGTMIQVVKGGYGPLEQFNSSMTTYDKNIKTLQQAFDEATDPSEKLADAKQLSQAIYDQYQMQYSFVTGLVDAIEAGEQKVKQLKQEIISTFQSGVNWVIQMQQKIDSLGGTPGGTAQLVGNIWSTYGGQIAAAYAGQTPGQKIETLNWVGGLVDAAYQSKAAEIQAGARSWTVTSPGNEQVIQPLIDEQQKQLEVIKAWEGLLDNVTKTITSLERSDANPANQYQKLSALQTQISDTEALYGAATGADKTKYGATLIEQYQAAISMGQKVYANSPEQYRALYNRAMGGLEGLKAEGEAQTDAEKQLEIQKKIEELQGQIVHSSSVTMDNSAEINAQMAALNKDALPYYKWIQQEGAKQFVQEMIDDAGKIDETTAAVDGLKDTLISVIGPGTKVNEYLQNLRDDTSAKLKNIQDDLDTFHDQFIADLKEGALVDVNVDVTVENGGGSTGVAYDPNRPWLTPHELPQLAGGMEYVPSNKYGPVYLDEAEAVLTAPQARQWRGDSSGGDLNITFQTLLKVADAGGVDGKKLFRQFENELLEAFAQRSLKDNRFLQKLRARLEKVQ